jgi:hypothetical protein
MAAEEGEDIITGMKTCPLCKVRRSFDGCRECIEY